MSVTEQRYKAVQAVLAEGRAVGQVASEWDVCRQTIVGWRATKATGLKAWAIARRDRHTAPTRCLRW
jgi:hypothetical protein